MRTAGPPLPRTIWLLSENRRTTVAAVVASALTAVVLSLAVTRWEPLVGLVRTDPTAFMLLCCVLVWTLMTVLHTTLTLLAYRGFEGDEFTRAINADPAWRKRSESARHGALRWLMGEGPSSWPVTVSVLSLIVVMAMVLRPALRAIPLALGMALLMVAVSWLNIAVMYALQYARMDAEGRAFAFPGERPRALSDYLYIAIGVQTTFGTTDVEVLTRDLRRYVMGQGILAFVFNSVIVAMIISLLLGLT